MEITEKLLIELQNRLKVGSRRGVHLNAIPARSRYKFDITRLSHIDENLPINFINALLEDQPLKFKISWKDNVPDLNLLFEEDQTQLVKITKSFENLINQTAAIESEKGINTFGFGYPILARRDQADNKLTVAPILIWSLRIKPTKEFNTWEIVRSEDDPIYINEVLINHIQNDSKIEIDQLSSDFLDDGLIDKEELLDICTKLIKTLNSTTDDNLREIFQKKMEVVKPIPDKKHYEKLPLTSNNAFIDFGGLFSIFEVQKQNIIQDYGNLLQLEGMTINLDEMESHSFQPISSVETDPSQQGILHALENTRNILIQGPPGTGKSQSLTAILVNALENKKKTIVVCEKKTALEVLHKQLCEKGLTYQCTLIKDIVRDRKVVVNSVRDRVDNSMYRSYRYNHSKETLDTIINKSKSLIESVNKKHRKLDQKLVGKRNWTTIVGELLTELRDNKEDHSVELEKGLFTYDADELSNLLEIIRNAQNLYTNYKPNKNLSFLNPEKLTGDNPYKIEQDIKDAFIKYKGSFDAIKQDIIKYQDEYVEIRKKEVSDQLEYIKNEIQTFEKKYEELQKYLSYLKLEYVKARKADLDKELLGVEDHIKIVETLYQQYSTNVSFLDGKNLNSFSFKFSSIFSKEKKQLKKDIGIVESRLSQVESFLYQCDTIFNVDFGTSLEEKKKRFYTFLKDIEQLKLNCKEKVEKEFDEFKNDTFLVQEIGKQNFLITIKALQSSRSEHLKSFGERSSDVLNEFNKSLRNKINEISAFLKNADDLQGIAFSGTLGELNNQIKNLSKSIEEQENNLQVKIADELEKLDVFSTVETIYKTNNFKKLLEDFEKLNASIVNEKWLKSKFQYKTQHQYINAYEEILEKYNTYFENNTDLFSAEFKWFQYFNSLSEKEKIILQKLKVKQDWRKTFLIFYLNAILSDSASIDLPTDDNDLIELNNSLSELESEQIKFINEYWYSKQIDATRGFNNTHINLAVENLYNKRSGKRHKRLSLRQIVKSDLDLFTTFFPVILTTPDVCSNLFKGKNQYFDIVMFDEASQLKLEDNLPAMLKGKQIIIAGDEHQMPPSNYFSKTFDSEIDDEDFEDENEIRVDRDNMLLSCESLLDFASELNFDKKHLDFHYRSRHPYLIDFSNHAFYNQRLKPLPNEFEYVPISYVPVNGTYFESANIAEVDTILSILDKNISRYPNGEYPSVGIATFNIHQRNLIISKINERRKLDHFYEFNQKILELEENGLFVKNLENIQGDERDVIILSTTYGFTEEGKFAHRFGAINHQKGYKLLNVIITRAKYKIYVCSSIPEKDFLGYKEYLTAEGANNRRAVFFAYLAYAKAVSDQNDEARLAILNALSENSNKGSNSAYTIHEGLESPFEEEVYNALLDHFDEKNIIPQLQFAGFRIDMVYDTGSPGLPKIAIECDGASYHSSQEAYLHDRHRQKILENHGFVFHRIWSTNWWRNSKKETELLVQFIKNIENSDPTLFEDKSETKYAFTNDVEVIGAVIQNDLLESEAEISDVIDAVSEPKEKQVKLFQEVIKINSKVKIKYLNNDKDIKVHIVDEEITAPQKSKRIQKINCKSTLGVALIGETIGKRVKVGKMDNYVEVLEIKN
ncbi:AAA domain-containing protein [Kordia sp.]|uniref:AAA domain-containing protein n=1 Tax=Kordia sp. TaxID=1965332 RepID=UPI003D27CDAE